MKNCLKLILLLVCIASTAHSQPGSPTLAAGPCLTITQRVRLGDSLAMLAQVRQAALAFRTAADIAQRTAGRSNDALVAQQWHTTEARAEADQWKGKARRRGLLNWLGAALAAAAAYYVTHPHL